MRLRKIKNIEEKILNYEGIIIYNAKDYKGKWQSFFNNNNPIYIEIGMGKGKFIFEMAKKNKEVNFLGLELAQSVIVKAGDKLKKENVENLKLINLDASKICEYFNDGEIEKIFLNFSDPWPKTKHEKRRLTSSNFLKNYKKILSNNGTIEMKTDNRQLFEYSVISFNKELFKFEDLNLNLHEKQNDVITTEYEDKFKELGNTIYYIKVRK